LVDIGENSVIRARAERHFYKMSGSGNDFVFVDNLDGASHWPRVAEAVQRICNRRMGIGADGVVFLDPSESQLFRMVYLNSDGSRAEFCGNAALCSTRLATTLGLPGGEGADFAFESDYGVITARVHADGNPEVDLPEVRGIAADVQVPLSAGEEKMGMATVGVPHLVVLCENADQVDLRSRGKLLRYHAATRGGANVDFVSPLHGGREWRMRTYERGVEGETLACGSGAVASALLASIWADDIEGTAGIREVVIRTSSGLPLIVRGRVGATDEGIFPSLRGEGRVVFEGDLRPW
jgi:diaminopimelate epimerase